jgi:hypothetical protein
LQQLCNQSGKAAQTIIRIPCHELENWYLGDLVAVELALGIANLAKKQGTEKFRTPDRLANAAEELVKLTKRKYLKVSGSRDIGKHLSPENNYSYSFQVFMQGLNRQIMG